MPPDVKRPPGVGNQTVISNPLGEVVDEARVALAASTTMADSWVDRIRPHLVGAVVSILAAGRELNEAKAALPHGQFGPLLDQLGLSQPMASRFMTIAKSNVLSKYSPVNALPAAVSVLATLAQLDDDVLEAAIENGEVTASTTRQQAAKLVSRSKHPLAFGRALTAPEASTLEDLVDDIAADIPCLDRPSIRAIVYEQEIAEHLYRTGELGPVPPWWTLDNTCRAVELAIEFVTWMENVGIEPASFMDEFLDDGPIDLERHLDDEALTLWWPKGSVEDRRLAALGHWFSWHMSRTQPAVAHRLFHEASS